MQIQNATLCKKTTFGKNTAAPKCKKADKVFTEMTTEEHVNLNKIWTGKACVLCGRKYPETILNIEAVIHHHAKPQCLDTKDCNKFRKKNK